MINKEEVETLVDLFADVIDSLSADLETGSHLQNNWAAEKWAKDHPRTTKAIDALGAWITKQERLHESID